MSQDRKSVDADFAIVGATIITMNDARSVIADGALAVKDDEIVWIGARAAFEAEVSAKDIINADNDVVCPGFINAHVHTTGDPLTRHYSPDYIGGAEALMTWVIPRYMSHTPEDEGLSAKYCAIELMKSGTTTFIEAGTIRHLDEAVQGFRETGIRGRVGAWVEGRAYDGDMAAQTRLVDEAVKILEDEIDKYPDHQGEKIAAWPILVGHNMNPDEVWLAAKRLADDNTLSVLAHMSPYQSDPDWFLAETGARPVEHLNNIGALGSNVLLTHMTHIDDREAEIVAEIGTSVVYCPFAALKGGFGVSAVGKYTKMLQNGVKIAFATDGYDPEILQAARVGASTFKDLEQTTATMSAMGALEAITCDAAAALGMSDQIGSLDVGKKADILCFDTDNFQWRPLLSPLAQLLWSADARSLRDVWIDGQRVIQDGLATLVDEDKLRADAQQAGDRIIKAANLPKID
ncbi:MAG: amidohydrolase family protein [Pseudomonadota bacterium]